MAGERLIYRGPVKLGLIATPPTVANWAKVALNLPVTLEDVADATIGYQQRVHGNVDWTATIDFELPLMGRNLTPALSIGGYTGVLFREWSLTVEATLREGTGGTDDWKQYTPEVYDWSIEASKWESTASYAAFVALVQAQSATAWAAVAFASQYGSGDVLLDKADWKGGGEIRNESLSGKGTDGGLTSSDTYITLITAAIAQCLTDGFATAIKLDLADMGYGLCHAKSVKYTAASQGKVTGAVEVQGTGAWTEAVA